MTATLYGKELRLSKSGEFIGINLGYNFYCEHEFDVDKVASRLNQYCAGKSFDELLTMSTMQRIKYGNARKKQEKSVSKWDNTPFKGTVLFPNVIYTQREIIIDNTDILSKYNLFLTDNGKHTILIIGTNPEQWRKQYGDRRKFSEEELLYMPKYNANMSVNPGFMMSGQKEVRHNNSGFAAAWAAGADNIEIIVSEQLEAKTNLTSQIINALKNGNLAVVQSEKRLFKDRGLILIDLENAYKIR